MVGINIKSLAGTAGIDTFVTVQKSFIKGKRFTFGGQTGMTFADLIEQMKENLKQDPEINARDKAIIFTKLQSWAKKHHLGSKKDHSQIATALDNYVGEKKKEDRLMAKIELITIQLGFVRAREEVAGQEVKELSLQGKKTYLAKCKKLARILHSNPEELSTLMEPKVLKAFLLGGTETQYFDEVLNKLKRKKRTTQVMRLAATAVAIAACVAVGRAIQSGEAQAKVKEVVDATLDATRGLTKEDLVEKARKTANRLLNKVHFPIK